MTTPFDFDGRLNITLTKGQLNRLSKQIQQQLGKPINTDVKINGSNLKSVERQVRSTGGAIEEATGSMREFGREAAFAVRRFGAFTVAVGIFRRFSGAIKQSVSDAIDFERELVRIGQVANLNLRQLQPLREEVFRLATTYGVSSSAIVDAARTLTQAGISADEVRKSLEALTKTELAPTFGDITQTTEAAIAIFRQFGTSAEDLEGQLSSINSVASQFAVESNDIVQVIRKAGGVFQSSGGSLEELISLFTAVRSTTRESADSIATGLRTIFVRLQRGELQDQLEQLGVSLRDSQNLFVGPFEALKRISGALRELDPRSETVAKITESLGGFRQVSRVTPLIQSFTEAQKALNVALSSQGSLSNDVAQAQESIAVQFAKLREEFAKLISDIQNDKVFRDLAFVLIEVSRAAIEVANSIRPLLPIISTLFAFNVGRGGLSFARGFIERTSSFGAVRRNSGGLVPGRGANKDSVLTYLTKGEFVLRRDAVDAIGIENLEKLNNIKPYNKGGVVGMNAGGLIGSGPSAGLFGGLIGLTFLSRLSDESNDAANNIAALDSELSGFVSGVGSLLTDNLAEVATAVTAFGFALAQVLPVLQSRGIAQSLAPSVGTAFGTSLVPSAVGAISGRFATSGTDALSRQVRDERQQQRIDSKRRSFFNEYDSNKEEVRRLTDENKKSNEILKRAQQRDKAIQEASFNKYGKLTPSALNNANAQAAIAQQQQRIIAEREKRIAFLNQDSRNVNNRAAVYERRVANTTRTGLGRFGIARRGISNTLSRAGSGIRSFAGRAASGAGRFLTSGGFLGTAAALGADPLLRFVGGDELANRASGTLQGAGFGAALGSAFGPAGTVIGGALGGLVGILPELAKNSELVRSTIGYLSLGLIDFQSAAEEARAVKIENLGERIKKTLSVLDVPVIGTPTRQNEVRQERLRSIFSDAGDIADTKFAVISDPNISGQERRDELEKINAALVESGNVLVEEFEKIRQANPSKSLSQIAIDFAGGVDEAGSVLYTLNTILQQNGQSIEDLAEVHEQYRKTVLSVNYALLDQLQTFRRREQVVSAGQGASFAAEPFLNTATAETGRFTQVKLSQLFDRAIQGTIAPNDFNSGSELIRTINNIRDFGGVAEPIADQARAEFETRTSIRSILEDAVSRNEGIEDVIIAVNKNLSSLSLPTDTITDDLRRAFESVQQRGSGVNIETGLGQLGQGELESIIQNLPSESLRTFGALQKIIENFNGNLQQRLNERLQIENTLSNRINGLRDAQFRRQDQALNFGLGRGVTVAEAGARDRTRLGDILRGTGFGGDSSVSNLSNRLLEARAEQELAQKRQDVEASARLNQEINRLTSAMEYLRDSSEEAATIQQRLNDLQERQAGGRNILEQFLTGDNSTRVGLQRSVKDALFLQQGGQLSGSRLSSSLGILRDVSGEDAATQILQNLVGPAGKTFFQPVGQTGAGNPLFQQQQQIAQQQVQAGQSLVGDSISSLSVLDEAMKTAASVFTSELIRLLQEDRIPAAQVATQPQSVQHTGHFTHKVDVNINGTEVLNKLEPSVQTLISNHVNKALQDFADNNGLSTTPESNASNGGVYGGLEGLAVQ